MRNKLVSIFSLILFAVIVSELVFLLNLNKFKSNQNCEKTQPASIAYSDDEIKNSGTYFTTVINKAKKNNISVGTLAAYLNGANMAKSPMVQNYVVSTTAKGRVEVIDSTKERISITLVDVQNPNDKVVFIYHSDFFSKIEMVPKTFQLANLKKGDILTITDSVDMKTFKNVKAVIVK